MGRAKLEIPPLSLWIMPEGLADVARGGRTASDCGALRVGGIACLLLQIERHS